MKTKRMLTFAAAVFFLIITPGPGVLSTAGVGSAFGYRAGVTYVFGLFLGTNLVALAVVTGLAAIVLSYAPLRIALVWLSAGYLLYLALRIALAGRQIAFIRPEKPPGILGGMALQAINPKAYAVNTALFTGFAFWPDSLTIEVLLKFLITNAIWTPIHLAWLAAGVALHRLNLTEETHSAINVSMAISMLAVVALAVWAQI